ncbi:MAG TPA: Ig-like domain-containing protein [Holophagaceae bacterium]|nr:Ig-like domain-containing protein [Holophagaceae bacterium]
MQMVTRLTALLCFVGLPGFAQDRHPDHHEFDAALHVPFKGDTAARSASLDFHFEDAPEDTLAIWRLELVDARGAVLRTFDGETPLARGKGIAKVAMEGRLADGRVLPQGFYGLRLTAVAASAEAYLRRSGSQSQRVSEWLSQPGLERQEQEGTFCVGPVPRLKLRPFEPLAVGAKAVPGAKGAYTAQAIASAPGGLPYTIYLGNLHSQTNHSDGGQAVGSCAGAETPQGGTQGPAEAFEMMRVQAGGDFLLASEHNHMFDGSTGTNTALDPTDPNYGSQLFARGLGLAATYRVAHPDFLALYGMEWGVISNGGHLNILNPDGLATWESNASSQLLGDFYTPKSDYPSLYTFMRGRNWIGQFNHPQTSQFGNMVYTADGDAVMALCEVVNTSAFSKNITETETSRSFYEGAFKRLLETGYHVAPSTDQDNHCANWGLSYGNRTGVLIPTGTPLTMEAFLDAIRARRVFATMDKTSQIVLTANDAIQGQRISNGGALNLKVNYASTTPGRAASQIQIWEGVPGVIGSSALLSDGADTLAVNPAPGPHFYYAVITQDNGDKLWSAPIWVDQAAGAVSANITQPSANLSVPTGSSVDFLGVATTSHAGITSTTWTFGDGDTASGTAASHTFTNAGTTSITRTVTFTATDDQGAVGSATRLVTVLPAVSTNTPPTLSALPNQSIPRNGGLGPLAFTASDAETPAGLLTVTARSSNQALIPDANLTLEGADGVYALSLVPAPDQVGSAVITLTVTDGASASTSRTFTVSVGATGQPRLIISQYYEGLSNNKWLEVTNVGTGAYDAALAPLYLGSWFNPITNGTTYAVTPIPGTLAPGASLVFKNGSAVLPAAANVTGTPVVNTAVLNFNGDDITYITPVNAANATAYAARVDAIGENSAFWATSVSGGYGKDSSFIRAFPVTAPNPTFTVGEWTKVALATVDGAATGASERLGEHAFNHAPSLSDIPSQELIAGATLPAVPFSAADDQGASTLVYAFSSSNPTLLPVGGIVLGGADGARTLTLTPVADQVGSASVTVTATDALGASSSTSFLLTVKAPPVAITGVTVTPESLTLAPGRTFDFQVQVLGTGSYSSVVTWSAEGGSIDATGHYLAPALEGQYLVTARSVQDATQAGQARVTVFNAPPTAQDQTLELDEDTPLPIVLTGVDPEAAPLTYAVVQAPQHGTLSGVAPNLVYTPAADFNGLDAFTFTVSDGAKTSAPATARLTVRPVNDLPLALAQALTTQEDAPLALTLAGSDADGDALSFAVVQAPAHGQLTGSAPNLVYTPEANFSGHDTFTFVVSDGGGSSAPATVELDVTPVNDAPSALPMVVNTLEDAPVAVTLGGTDVEGQPLTYTVLEAPAHGTLSGTAPNLTYTPAANFSGHDAFTFKVNDGSADSASATVGLVVQAVNDAPVALPQALGTGEDTPLALQLAGTDVEGAPLTFQILQAPAHGTLSGTAPALVYTPAANYNGTDSFTFKVNDGQLDSAPATVSLAVASVNDAPVALPQELTVTRLSLLPIHLMGSDAEGDRLQVTLLTRPKHGLLIGDKGNHYYLPFPGFIGEDSLTFKVNDGRLDSAPAAVRIHVVKAHGRF